MWDLTLVERTAEKQNQLKRSQDMDIGSPGQVFCQFNRGYQMRQNIPALQNGKVWSAATCVDVLSDIDSKHCVCPVARKANPVRDTWGKVRTVGPALRGSYTPS